MNLIWIRCIIISQGGMKLAFLLMLLIVGFADIRPVETTQNTDAVGTSIKSIDAPESPGTPPKSEEGNTPDDLLAIEPQLKEGNAVAKSRCSTTTACDLSPKFYCCPYHWIFALDASNSAAPSFWKIWVVRWWFRWWIWWWWCPQKVSSFGFDDQYSSYEEYVWRPWLNVFLPPAALGPQTDYAAAIIKALQLIVKYHRWNQCLFIFSDGGDSTLDSVQFHIWNYVRKGCYECDLCVQCFYFRGNPQPPISVNFNIYQDTCKALGSGPLGVAVYSSNSAWDHARALRKVAWTKTWNSKCKCPKPWF